jgi:TonB family protein
MSKIVVLLAVLYIISSISMLSAELNQLRIVGQAEQASDIIPARYETVNRERAACIIFLTDLAVDLDFRPRIDLVGLANPASGQFHVYVDPLERVIDVHALGYRPLPVVLRDYGVSRLRSGDVYKLQLTGDKSDFRSIENINIVISTEPRNAIVYLNEKRAEDNRQVLATMGKNTLRIELDGYKSIIDEIEVSEQRTLFEYEMELALDVPVKVDTDPQGATVFLDDVNCGTTPVQFFYQEGEYRLRIVLENHAVLEEIIEVRGPHTEKSYRLEDIRGSLTIKTGPNSRIFMNNEEYPQGVTNLKLLPQLIQLRITTPQAQDITRSIVVREREHHEIELFPQINTGSIGVSVMPIDAQVELTGDTGEKFNSQGSQTFPDLPIGIYEMEIKADNHITHKESFEIKKDEVVRKQVILEEVSGGDGSVQETSRYVAYEEPPQVTKRIAPEYPVWAIRANIQGQVLLDVEVLVDGSVGAIEVVRSLMPALDALAVSAVKQWEFKPAKVQGQPVAVWVSFPIIYSID